MSRPNEAIADCGRDQVLNGTFIFLSGVTAFNPADLHTWPARFTIRVPGASDLRLDEIEPAPSFGTRLKADYLLGMARSGKKFCLMLDTDRVLSSEELLELNDSSETAESNSDEPVLDLQPVTSAEEEAAGA